MLLLCSPSKENAVSNMKREQHYKNAKISLIYLTPQIAKLPFIIYKFHTEIRFCGY